MVEKSLILQSVANIAKEVSASAIIIVSGDQPFDIDTDIPVLIASPSAIVAVGHIFETEKVSDEKPSVERLQALTTTLQFKASTGSEFILDASAMAFINSLIDGDRVVGIVSQEGTFTIVVHDLKDNTIVKELKACSERVNLNILKSVLNIAIDLGTYGREGKPVGTAFIIGDTEEVLRRSHQLVLNPYLGHPREDCYILEPSNRETVKEFAQLDGMFVLDSEGYIHAGGRYLDVDAREVETVKGLGGRHASAAAITRDTEAVAVTVSESDGVVRVFRDGIQIIQIDPRTSNIYRYR